MEKLRKDFENFHAECMNLKNLVNTFDQLFGKDDDPFPLAGVADYFFCDLSHWLMQAYLIKVGRLTDSAGKGAKKNLTVKYLVSELQAKNLLTDEIKAHSDGMERYRIIVGPSRNKKVAHYDLEESRTPVWIARYPEDQLQGFLNDLQGFNDKVGIALGLDLFDFPSARHAGDVVDFVAALRKMRDAGIQGKDRQMTDDIPNAPKPDKPKRPQQVFTLLVEVGRKTGDGLPKGATGAGLMVYASGVDEAEAVRETVAILKQADMAVLDVTGYGTLDERLAEGHEIAPEERALMDRALAENAVIVAQMEPVFEKG